MLKKLRFFFFSAIILLFSACASIVSKSKYPVSIDSEPQSARITIIDKHGKEVFNGHTPADLKLKSGAGFFSRAIYDITISKPGYEDMHIPVSSKLNAWYFGNILLGGFIGLLIVDPATGAMWRIKQDNYFADFTKDGKANGGVSFRVKLLQQVTPEEKVAMVRIR